MNQDRQSKSPPSDQLPKSVKVRSTCNACQQAKIRCSHEKPSCRRCQKHNIDCIYSISRRLGRPAKKDSQYGDHPVDKEQIEDRHHQRDKKTKCIKKKKMREEKTQTKTDDEDFVQGRGEKEGFDNITINDTLIDDISVDDTSLEAPTLTDGDRPAHFLASDTIDLSSDSWLQDFLSSPLTDLEQERNLLDSLGLDSPKSDNAFAAVTSGLRDLSNPSRSFPVSSPETRDQPPAASYYSPVDISPTHKGMAIGCAQGIVDAQSSYPDYPRRHLLAWPQQSSMADNFPIRLPNAMESPNVLAHTKGPKRGCEFSFSSDEFAVDPSSLTTSASRQCQSQCHEQTIRELIHVNICASRTSTSANIDSILSCQRVVQQVAETILQCTVCSKTRVNLLIVVVVSIDSLITTLEAVTSVESGIMEGISPEHYNPLFLYHDYSEDISIGGSSRRYKGGNLHFRAQVETCPLLVGGFCVPSEDKFSFVKQVFHSRLAGLLAVVRRIRIRTEQMMAISSSHGRLIMMMETDRKLQLIMMKIKMLTR